jgi:membrane-associated phospholipid phosphatase
VDWTLFHFFNHLLAGHDGAQDIVERFAALSVPVFAVATVLLWLGDRPGHPPRWRLAATSALAAAGLALLINQAIGHLWFRDRPSTTHPGDTLLLSHPSHDPSFPSDHASAAFAIAFAIFFFSRRAGATFLVAAILIAFSRVFVGLHYPGDVAAGALVGLASAAVIVLLLARPARIVTDLATRVVDPIVRVIWSLKDGIRTARRST